MNSRKAQIGTYRSRRRSEQECHSLSARDTIEDFAVTKSERPADFAWGRGRPDQAI